MKIECEMQMSFIELKSIESAFILLLLITIIMMGKCLKRENKQRLDMYV
jgi:hypothetical protein